MPLDFVFLDSGTGGLPYLELLKKKSPESNCVYFADNKNFPYGTKTHEEICECANQAVDLILKKFNPKLIVIACNTISVNSLDLLRKNFPLVKFVGTVPAIKLAAKFSKKRRLGLLATSSTIQNPYNEEIRKKFAPDCELILREDSKLISFIEHKFFFATHDEILKAVQDSVDFFYKQNVDVIILGCTHFLNIADEIQEVAGNKIKVVDSREGVVNQALKLLEKKDELQNQIQKDKLFVTGYSKQNEDKKFQKNEDLKKDFFEYQMIAKKFNLEFIFE